MATSRERIARRRHEKFMKRYLNFPLCPEDKQKAVRYVSPGGKVYYHFSNSLSSIRRVFDLVMEGETITRRFTDKDENNWGHGAEVHTATGIQARFVGYTTLMNAVPEEGDLPEVILELVQDIKEVSKKSRKTERPKEALSGAADVGRIAGILGIQPAALRRILRRIYKEKPAGGWSWPAEEVGPLMKKIKEEL